MPSKVCYIFLFGYALIVSQALRLAPQHNQPGDFPPLKGYVNVNGCPQTVSKDMWGLWIDGRDAHSGIDAYGHEYHGPVMSSLQVAYQMAGTRSGVELSYPIFTEMVKALNCPWRDNPNPVYREVKTCHEVLPRNVVQEIMSTVVDLSEEKRGEVRGEEKYKPRLMHLFDNYNKEVHEFPGRDAELLSIARLLQNMAFLHPFGDRNGRSRLLLLQYLLRQRHIGCGTMMYNDNKNIYFQTASDYAKTLEEGIKIYDEASANNFSTNPWNTIEVEKFHHAQFPTPAYMPELKQCWRKMQNLGNMGTSPEMFRIPKTNNLKLVNGAARFHFGADIEANTDREELINLKNWLQSADVNPEEFARVQSWKPSLTPRLRALWHVAVREAGFAPDTVSEFGRRTVKFPKSWVTKIIQLNEQADKSRGFTFSGSMGEHSNPTRRAWVHEYFREFGTPTDFFKDNSAGDNYTPQGPWDKTREEPHGFRPRDCDLACMEFDLGYYSEMSKSNFTLCPGGSQPWSQRYWEAIAVRSMPLIHNEKEDVCWDADCSGTHELQFMKEIGYKHATLGDELLVYDKAIADENFRKWYKYQTFEEGDNTPPAT